MSHFGMRQEAHLFGQCLSQKSVAAKKRYDIYEYPVHVEFASVSSTFFTGIGNDRVFIVLVSLIKSTYYYYNEISYINVFNN